MPKSICQIKIEERKYREKYWYTELILKITEIIITDNLRGPNHKIILCLPDSVCDVFVPLRRWYYVTISQHFNWVSYHIFSRAKVSKQKPLVWRVLAVAISFTENDEPLYLQAYLSLVQEMEWKEYLVLYQDNEGLVRSSSDKSTILCIRPLHKIHKIILNLFLSVSQSVSRHLLTFEGI